MFFRRQCQAALQERMADRCLFQTKNRLVEPTSSTRRQTSSTSSTVNSKPQDDCYLQRRLVTRYSHHTLFVMATSAQNHSYPPTPSASHDITRSDTNYSSTSAVAKHRYLPDDDDTEAQALPKEGSPQWDQPPPPPELQRPARKWWQGVRIHTTYPFFTLL